VLLWRLRTRLARLGGQYYWFRKNINANRGMEADTNFFSPVFFLLNMVRQNRAAFEDYSSRQLTSAMLDDLQESYRRGLSPWRGWARPVYPALILDDVPSRSARARLLLQINHDRLEGRWDPLLVIAVVADQASYAALQRDARADTAGAGNGGVSLAGMAPADLYKQWSSQFPGAMRPVAPDGWFLFLSLEDSARPRNQAAGGGKTGVRNRRRRTRRRPLWTRVPSQVLALVLAAALATGLAYQWHQTQQRSQELRQAAFQQRFCASRVWRLAGQCVGLAPAGFEFGMHDWTASLVNGTAVPPGTRHVKGDLTVSQLEADINRENGAVRQQAADGRNTVVTIAYMGPLTLPGDVSNPQTDGVRELAGVYAAQLAWDGTPEDGVQNDPLVQILVANAGASMQGQYKVAQQIIELAHSHDPLVGVVGVGMNEPTTPETVSALGRAGVPIVGTTNSMDAHYPLYFQLAPDDRREAQVGADYLATLPGRHYGVRMVDTTSGYTRELGANVAEALSPAARRSMPEFTYQSPRQLPGLVNEACQKTGGKLNLIYYLGRSQDLPWLITQGLAQSAQCANNHVTILSGDDASKYAAPLPGNITLDYTALTFPPAWQTCYRDGNLPPFYASYLHLLQSQGISHLPANPLDNPLLTDGHTVLGYDATTVMENATTQVFEDLAGQAPGLSSFSGIRVTPGDVWGQLRSAAEPPGASGLITFQPGFEQDKFVPVVQEKAQAAPHVVYAEGVLTPGSPSTCPGNRPTG
jgi:hypothetical protein